MSDSGLHEEERPPPPPPPLTDPRDHSLLEYIYNEMHASRFINLEPLALLTNSLPLYFTGACPFMIMAPSFAWLVLFFWL